MDDFTVIEEQESSVTFSQGELNGGFMHASFAEENEGSYLFVVSGVKADGETTIEPTEVLIASESKPTPSQVFFYVVRKIREIIEVTDAK